MTKRCALPSSPSLSSLFSPLARPLAYLLVYSRSLSHFLSLSSFSFFLPLRIISVCCFYSPPQPMMILPPHLCLLFVFFCHSTASKSPLSLHGVPHMWVGVEGCGCAGANASRISAQTRLATQVSAGACRGGRSTKRRAGGRSRPIGRPGRSSYACVHAFVFAIVYMRV